MRCCHAFAGIAALFFGAYIVTWSDVVSLDVMSHVHVHVLYVAKSLYSLTFIKFEHRWKSWTRILKYTCICHHHYPHIIIYYLLLLFIVIVVVVAWNTLFWYFISTHSINIVAHIGVVYTAIHPKVWTLKCRYYGFHVITKKFTPI